MVVIVTSVFETRARESKQLYNQRLLFYATSLVSHSYSAGFRQCCRWAYFDWTFFGTCAKNTL